MFFIFYYLFQDRARRNVQNIMLNSFVIFHVGIISVDF